MKSGLTVTKDEFKKLAQALNALPMQEVLVGIPEDKAPREGDPINNATIGYIMENGAPEVNIPARPWLVPGVIENKPKISSYFKQAGQYALKADKEGMQRAMMAAGQSTVNKIKEVINTSEYPPLAEATLAARRRKGRTGTRPLVDSGDFRNSVNFVMRDNSKGKK